MPSAAATHSAAFFSPRSRVVFGDEIQSAEEHILLRIARIIAAEQALPYAGGVTPQAAYSLFVDGLAILVDVRTAEERKFVGHVPGSVHVPWQIGSALIRNPRFTRELETRAGKDAVILLLCRSGKRSAAAAEAARKAGFGSVFNVLEGFEGELDPLGQRGSYGGWRHHDLPWVQD